MDIIPFKRDLYKEFDWEQMTWEDVKKSVEERRVVIVPLGSIEQHGPMLPLECDKFLAQSWSLESSRKVYEKYKVKCIVAPVIPFGYSPHHSSFPGTISLHISTYITLLQDIINTIIDIGFKKIVCISGHGGNVSPCEVALREIMRTRCIGNIGVKLYLPTLPNEIYSELNNQGQYNFHADAVETSYYLFHKPWLVKKEKIKKPTLLLNCEPIHVWQTKEITPSGASGNPELATEEYGKRLFEDITNHFAEFLRKVHEDENI